MMELGRTCMADDLDERLSRLLPEGRGLWIPMYHGISGYPEKGLGDVAVAFRRYVVVPVFPASAGESDGM